MKRPVYKCVRRRNFIARPGLKDTDRLLSNFLFGIALFTFRKDASSADNRVDSLWGTLGLVGEYSSPWRQHFKFKEHGTESDFHRRRTESGRAPRSGPAQLY